MSPATATVPLVPRRRVAGRPAGALRSVRRGTGADLAGLRPYAPGDDIRRIDHRASARRSAATGRDEFVVREHLTEEAVRVIVSVDPSPSMALFPEELPWLSKPAAVEEAYRVLVASADAARCPHEERPPASLGELEAPPGSFVFLLSDFLAPPGCDWRTLALRYDAVPVVFQDPVWEQSFPDVAGATLPVAGPAGGRARSVRLTRAEVAARRLANEGRLRDLLDRFAAAGLDHVLVSSDGPAGVLEAFSIWADGRSAPRRLVRWGRG